MDVVSAGPHCPPTVNIVLGDCLEVLRTFADGSAQTCVTSPPYYGLRDYNVAGQIGLEGTPDGYVARLVEVFREVRRVLKDDGTLFLNLGDSYGAGKNLLGIPWRVALALQADGWTLRQDCIWEKPNPMPESVRDRPTRAHEYVFLLSKSPRYFYDAQAVREPAVSAGREGRARSRADSFKREDSKRAAVIPGQTVGTHRPDRAESTYDLSTRNRRSVWRISTRPFKDAHFAVMPVELAEVCILAGSRPGDTVLDPFSGAGTTALAATRNGRSAIGAELNPEYLALGARRLAAPPAGGRTPRPARTAVKRGAGVEVVTWTS